MAEGMRQDESDEEGERRAENDADDAADDGQKHRFEQELRQDVAVFRAEGFAQADLARALRHRDQHDVHDADAADEQRDRRHRDQEPRQRAGDRAERVGQRLLGLDGEVVLGRIGDVVRLFERQPDIVGRLRHDRIGRRLDDEAVDNISARSRRSCAVVYGMMTMESKSKIEPPPDFGRTATTRKLRP